LPEQTAGGAQYRTALLVPAFTLPDRLTTPSHAEYPAGHPSLNGAAAAVLLLHFDDRQTFTLTTTGQGSRTYTRIPRALGRRQRQGLGRHALSQLGRDQLRDGRDDREVRRPPRHAAAPRRALTGFLACDDGPAAPGRRHRVTCGVDGASYASLRGLSPVWKKEMTWPSGSRKSA
jgi:hypothetical protein